MATKGLTSAVVAVAHTETTTGNWDGMAHEARLRNDAGEPTLRRAYAWVDPTRDPASRAAWRFLHHEVDTEGDVGAANITACRAAIAVLNGERSGASVPAADRRGVYNHLAAHISDAGLTPPELRADPLTPTDREMLIMDERRFTPGRVEVRASRGEARSIGGYAAVFGKLSGNLGGFVEIVEPGAFNRSRTEGWPGVICRYNHEDSMLLGTTNSGTLRLNVDSMGLEYEVDPPQARADIVELVSRGDIQRSSFAFRVQDEAWGLTEQGYPMRSVLSCQLIDVAPVISPAYLDTSASLRSLASFVGASEEEVRSAAAANDLRKFLTRTDGPKYTPPTKRAFGPAARMSLLGRARDPWADKV
jgi:Escherichia/Staphylococcus phage prohead protease